MLEQEHFKYVLILMCPQVQFKMMIVQMLRYYVQEIGITLQQLELLLMQMSIHMLMALQMNGIVMEL